MDDREDCIERYEATGESCTEDDIHYDSEKLLTVRFLVNYFFKNLDIGFTWQLIHCRFSFPYSWVHSL